MENIEIYRDDSFIVEIDGYFDSFLKSMIIKTVKLSKMQYYFLLKDVLKKLKENNWEYKGYTLKASSSVPIIEKYKHISLIEPFDIFEYVFDYFSTIEDLSDKSETMEILENFYETLNLPFFIDLYKTPIFGVDGVVVTKIEKSLLISFFKIDENNRGFE